MTTAPSSSPITIIKQDPAGNETWRYTGEVLERGDKQITIEAYFDRDDMHFHGMWLCKGDRFVETYYSDRWYNILEIHARKDDHLKGWYCNITAPAVIDGQVISYKDLALDLLVFPDGCQLILDEDEFTNLRISAEMQMKARVALEELCEIFQKMISSSNANQAL